jgi:maltose alpha-D-glucosyltransferase/alpha-amylase
VRPSATDPQWYQRAVFYELLLRGYADGNGDGQGDLQGLLSHLDHLDWLGVDCVWLLPFYESPLRDGGYDISDFFRVHPAYGTLADIVAVVEEAHRRGMKVIADLVMNHTSDSHEWFQESRQDSTNPKADWYVWSDDPTRWSEARVIFHDTETSNWSFDTVRGQWYWHRFFHHQPDLNYDNVEVQEALLDVVRFWLDVGLDGFRLDAVPYLYERDGTNGENLPETHVFLKRLRAAVDRSHPGRVLLAEANQWPSELRPYFGDGDECHMAFHFPLMSRMYLAAKRGHRGPIEAILAETPTLPDGCAWALFLRNHDELTLEMVTDAERDEMYEAYATDPVMRRNTGIGRRLAPLLQNNRPLIELFHFLLLTMPGSPVLYYGDEILMGDDIRLGDRDSVRTPMQWRNERNAGFSTATPEELYLPVIDDPVYGYQGLNVDAQRRNPGSFLRWLKELLEVRRRHPQFSLGEYVPLPVENQAVLAYLRGGVADAPSPLLCVANLDNRAQPALLPLHGFQGMTPHELIGGVAFPQVSDDGYPLTLGPRGFLAFELCDASVASLARAEH